MLSTDKKGVVMYKGSCLCGTVKIEITGDIKAVTHCHCTMCQKAHGAAFASFAASRDEYFSIIEGRSSIKRYESSPNYVRTFCIHCGSNIQWIHDSGETSGWSTFAISLLDTPFHKGKQKHIHTDYKAPWFSFSDNHSKFSGAGN